MSEKNANDYKNLSSRVNELEKVVQSVSKEMSDMKKVVYHTQNTMNDIQSANRVIVDKLMCLTDKWLNAR